MAIKPKRKTTSAQKERADAKRRERADIAAWMVKVWPFPVGTAVEVHVPGQTPSHTRTTCLPCIWDEGLAVIRVEDHIGVVALQYVTPLPPPSTALAEIRKSSEAHGLGPATVPPALEAIVNMIGERFVEAKPVRGKGFVSVHKNAPGVATVALDERCECSHDLIDHLDDGSCGLAGCECGEYEKAADQEEAQSRKEAMFSRLASQAASVRAAIGAGGREQTDERFLTGSDRPSTGAAQPLLAAPDEDEESEEEDEEDEEEDEDDEEEDEDDLDDDDDDPEDE